MDIDLTECAVKCRIHFLARKENAMKDITWLRGAVAFVAFVAFVALTGCAKTESEHWSGDAAKPGTIQTTGTLGSPSATTTIPGNQLPPPAPKFGGVIKETAVDSKPWWPPRVVPPKGAPNVLLIMTDDQGYGVSGTFGGVIPTPAMDRV